MAIIFILCMILVSWAFPHEAMAYTQKQFSSAEQGYVDLYDLSKANEEGEITIQSNYEDGAVTVTVFKQIEDTKYEEEVFFFIPKEESSFSDVVSEVNNKMTGYLANNTSNGTRGSHEENGEDSSLSVEGVVRINFTTSGSGSNKTILVTQVSGTYTIEDSSVSVIGQMVTFGCTGVVVNGSLTTQRSVRYPSIRNWTYGAPSSWQTIYDDSRAIVGVTNRYTLKRTNGNSNHTWTFRVSAMARSTDWSVL